MKKQNTEWFKEKVLNNKRGDGKDFKVLGEYTGTHNKIEFLYIPKNKKFLMTPNKFLSGRRPTFYPNHRGWQNKKGLHNTEWFKEQVKKLTGDEYSVLGEYTGYDNKILMQHNSNLCENRKFYMSPKMFIDRSHRCWVCSGHKPDKIVFLNKMKEKFKDTDFEVTDVNFKTNKVAIKHLSEDCGKTFYRSRQYIASEYHTSKNSLLCPYCNIKSKANNIVTLFLQKNNIKFIPESNLSGELDLMRYDFQIYLNDTKYILLELDGIQHKEKVDYFDSYESFEKRCKRDEIKNNYAKNHNISLYRIELPKQIKPKDEEEIIKKLTNILGHYKLL